MTIKTNIFEYVKEDHSMIFQFSKHKQSGRWYWRSKAISHSSFCTWEEISKYFHFTELSEEYVNVKYRGPMNFMVTANIIGRCAHLPDYRTPHPAENWG